MELTKEHFDQALKGLATQQSVDDLAGRLTTVETSLGVHTTALTNIATDVKTLLEHKTTTDHRLERIEHWAQQAGEKIGVKLEV